MHWQKITLVTCAVAACILLGIWWRASQRQTMHQPLLIPSPQATPTQQYAATTAAQLSPDSLYFLINAHRKDNKLSPLQINHTLEQSAKFKIQDMIANKYYRHTDLTDTPSWSFFRQAGYQYQLAGKNLSFALNSPWQIINGWMQSQSHNEQLLNPKYSDMGVALDCTTFAAYPDGGCIVVLHLGRE